MFIKFEGRLINTKEVQYVERKKAIDNQSIIYFHLRDKMSLEIRYNAELERDDAYVKLERLLMPVE